ncbi:hypothetical protein MMC28_011406 [Mycoblastus sanguinarius]|nr:hypothetical protein [Mycoblastus sanguinarius]
MVGATSGRPSPLISPGSPVGPLLILTRNQWSVLIGLNPPLFSTPGPRPRSRPGEMGSVEMDDMVSAFPWLRYHSDRQVLVCQRCQRGIRHPGLAAHLSKVHRDITTSQRRQITLFYQAKPLIVSDAFTPPSQPVPRVPGVQFFSDGLKCIRDGCSYISRNKGSMKKHAVDQHRWENPYTRGGSLRQRLNATYPWQTDILCQRLFGSGAGPSYYEILPETSEDADGHRLGRVDGVSDRDKDGIHRSADLELSTRDRILYQLSTFESERRGQNTIIRAGDETEANPWLRKTGWDEYLEGYNLEDLAPLVDLPRPDEPILRELSASIDRTIEAARELILA